MKISKEVQQQLEQLDAGDSIEFRYSNGIVFSRKEAFKCAPDCYSVTHWIDDSETFFDRAGIIEVLERRADAWDGNLTRRQALRRTLAVTN